MIPAADPHQHGLAPNAIGLLQSIVISIANSAPTAAMTVTFAALVVAAAGGGAIAILITMVPMLVIAYSFQRLNRWEANCGAQYVWVGRAIGPRLGFMTGWLVLGALMLGTVATVLPVGPSFLNLLGLDSSSQLGAVLSSTVLAARRGGRRGARHHAHRTRPARDGCDRVRDRRSPDRARAVGHVHLATRRVRVAKLVVAQPHRRRRRRQPRSHPAARRVPDRGLGRLAVRQRGNGERRGQPRPRGDDLRDLPGSLLHADDVRVPSRRPGQLRSTPTPPTDSASLPIESRASRPRRR